MSVTYDKFFRITNSNAIIFLEDDFTFEDSKEALFYGLTRLNYDSRKRMLEELKELGAEFINELQEFVDIISKYVSCLDWENEIPRDDVGTLFQIIERLEDGNKTKRESLRTIYERINIKELLKFKSTLNQYGVGIKIPNYFETLFNDYIYCHGEWKNYKVYTDFNAKTKDSFLKDLKEYGQSEETIICIIDNQLESEERALEILEEIERFSGDKRENIIAAILSSKKKQEKISSKIFAEYVSKETPDDLQMALAKSAYSLMLVKLKRVYRNLLEESFDDAIVNKDIAYYFAKMASYEGITNYKIVTDWINLIFRYKINLNNEIFDIIRLTQLMDILNDEELEYSSEMQKLNTFEAFDLSINKYYQPPAAGDIFRDLKGNYYVLVGQDCDLMTSQLRSGNNAVIEMVKASVVSQKNIEKYEKNLEYMYVNNFRENDSEQPQALEIKYSSRVYLDNAIIRLCCFNDEGKCQIHLNKELDIQIQDLIAPYLKDTYIKLQEFFSNIDNLKRAVGEKISMVLESEFSPRLTSLIQYQSQDDCIIFPYRRVARLNRNYVLYLYKLFLEYRGRHPFDCINLTRHASLKVPVLDSNKELPIEVILSGNREENRKHYCKKLDWYINSNDIEQIVREICSEDIHIKNSGLISLKETTNSIECIEDKRVMLTKTKKGVKIELN